MMNLITEKNPNQILASPKTTQEFYSSVAPSLCGFVKWVLSSAVASGVKTLYFLARDGYLLIEIAKKLVQKERLDINLEYLYCSRMSLRLASLRILSKEECCGFLLSGGINVTPSLLLSRLMLDEQERRAVYEDIRFLSDENEPLSKAELGKLGGLLKSSSVYNSLIEKKGREHYGETINYLRQSIDFSEKFAFVDSGWIGTIQHSFKVLLDSMGESRKLIGYYFGLYSKCNQADGEYYTYFFDCNSSAREKSKFSNHLFEAICSAPHGMTIGYETVDGFAKPLYNNEKCLNYGSPLYEMQMKALDDYIRENDVLTDIEAKKEQKERLYRLMYSPSYEFAEEYGKLLFSDDVTEERSFPLAYKLGKDECADLALIKRLYRKYKGKQNSAEKIPAYWIYGSLALTENGGKYRLRARIWEELWLIKKGLAKQAR